MTSHLAQARCDGKKGAVAHGALEHLTGSRSFWSSIQALWGGEQSVLCWLVGIPWVA